MMPSSHPFCSLPAPEALHEGFLALLPRIADMKRAFADSPDLIFPSLVRYIDYATDSFPQNNTFYCVSWKRKSFEHESEMRLIWWSMAEANAQVMFAECGQKYQSEYPLRIRAITTKLDPLIQQVYVSPTSADWFTGLVKAVTKRYGLTCPVIRSNLNDGPVY
jgi:hypothetical protein